MQVLKLTAICDQPSSRSTTLRSFMFDSGVIYVKAAKMTPAVDGKKFDLQSDGTKQPCSAAARSTWVLVVEDAQQKQPAMKCRKPTECGGAINFYVLRSEYDLSQYISSENE